MANNGTDLTPDEKRLRRLNQLRGPHNKTSMSRAGTGGTHDDLGTHPERREAEADSLEKGFNAPSASEPTYGRNASSGGAHTSNSPVSSSGSSSAPGNGVRYYNNNELKDAEARVPTGAQSDLRTYDNTKHGSDPWLANFNKEQNKQDAQKTESDAEGSKKIPSSDVRNNEGGIPFRDEKPGKLSSLRGRTQGFLKNHKWLVVGGLSGLGIMIGLVIFLLLIGSLLIPDFATHVEEYEFSRVLRTFEDRAVSETAERSAMEAADAGLSAKIKAQYQDVRDNSWGKLDQWRPEKNAEILKTQANMDYHYKGGIFGRGQLESISINGVDHELNGGFFFNTFHPVQAFKQELDVASAFRVAVGDSNRGLLGTLVNGASMRSIRLELGISRVAWIASKYQGKDAPDAAVQQDQDAYKAIDDAEPVGEDPGTLGSTETNSYQAEQGCVNDKNCLQDMITSGATEPKQAVAALVQGIDGTLMGRILGFLQSLVNPAIGILFQICMINAGSLVNSQPNIDAQDAELTRTFSLVASAADEQKYGSPKAPAEGIQAMANKLGNISQSNAELRASGETPDTSNYISPQASKAGQYSDIGILSVLTGPGIGTVSTKVCNAFLSPEGIALSTIVGILAAVGGDEALDGVGAVVKEITTKIVTQFTTKQGLKQFVGRTLLDSSIAVGGALLAKMIVLNSMGTFHNGLATGTDFANDADAGGSVNAQEVMQKEFYGVPMNDSDTAMDDQQDNTYVHQQVSDESVGQRYFAVSNPDSLISHIGMSMYGALYGKGIFTSLPTITARILNPFVTIPKVFSSLNSKVAFAATAQNTSADQHYGIVQWGFTPNEETLIDGTSQTGYQTFDNGKSFKFAASATDNQVSYQDLENAGNFTNEWNNFHARTGGDLEADIQNKYGVCYSDSMGTLLSKGYVVRDTNGNVDESKGLCSESQLGPSNAFDGETQSVFRWRLMQSYNNSVDNLNLSVGTTEQQ